MALWKCADCAALYAVGAPNCPQCSCTVRVEEGSEDDMAKVTVHGGPSNEAAAEVEGGEGVSAGSSSETSSAKPETSPGKSDSKSPSRARKTASRSGQDRTDSPTARPTDGGPAAGTSATDKS